VALVLGAGAQLGWAHIGVLAWLEEHRVPVRYVVGTSMGALVGAMYATGVPPSEIRDMAASVDWDTALSGEPPYDYLDFRRREDRRDVPGVLEFGANGGVQLPFGVSSSPEIGLLLSRASLPYNESTAFDDLALPFRAVSFDYQRLRKYVPSGGSLAMAIRASTAIPLAFAPTVTQRRLLGDGGVLESLPVPTAVETFHPDAVIAVNVLPEMSPSISDTEPIVHPTGERVPVRVEKVDAVIQAARLLQATWAQQTEAAKAALSAYGDRGVFLRPDVLESTKPWSQFDWFIQKGYEAAEGSADRLEKFRLSEEDWAKYVAWRESRRPARRFAPERVEAVVARPQGGRVESVEKRIESRVGKVGPLDASDFSKPSPSVVDLEDRLRRSLGSGKLLRVEYAAAPDGRTLRVFAEPKPYLPSLLYVSPSLTAREYLQTRASLQARLVRFDVAGSGSEGRLDLSLGSRNALAAEVFLPVGGSAFGFVRAHGDMEPWDVYSEAGRIGSARRESLGGGLGLGTVIGNQTELRLGFDAGRARTLRTTGPPTLPTFDGSETYGSVRLTHDSLDRAMIPTSGLRTEASFRAYLETPAGLKGLKQAEGYGSWFLPVGRGSFFAFGRAGTSFGDADPSEPFRMGGLFRFSALAPDEAASREYALGGAGYMLQVGKAPLGLASGVVRLGGWLEYGRADLLPFGLYRGWSATVGGFAETPFGPVFLGLSTDVGKRYRIQLQMGRLF
jgi:NTE family protein